MGNPRVCVYLLVGSGFLVAPEAFGIGFCEVTGHYYDFIKTYCNQPWTEAREQAAAKGGYLATVTSAEEQLCMSELQGGSWFSWWAGGNDVAVEGEWRWVTGPEGEENEGAGRQFWSGGTPASGGTTTAPDFYANWFTPPTSSEPNNSGNEDYLSWNTGGGVEGVNNFWNDVPLSNAAMCGYAIEWDFDPDPLFRSSFEAQAAAN